MILYRLTPRAGADLRSIWSYIAADNFEAADRVEEAIYDACPISGEGSPTRASSQRPNRAASSILDGASLP